MPPGDAAEYEAPSEPVLGKAALRFTRAIKPRNDLAANVHDLRVRVGAQAGLEP